MAGHQHVRRAHRRHEAALLAARDQVIDQHAKPPLRGGANSAIRSAR